MRSALVTVCLLSACTDLTVGPADDDPTSDPGPGDPGLPPPPPPPPSTPITVTLDNLQPGWLVTTSRLTDHAAPTEVTITSDGSPITLIGSARDVFFTTVTDEAGNLMSTHGMHAPCTMASMHRLDVPHDYPTIQAAIDAASPGDTVKVAAGTYTESVKMRPGVCLLGSGAQRTILDAQHEGRSLVDLSFAQGSAVVGFTLRNVGQRPECAAPGDVFLCSGNWYSAGIHIGGWPDPTVAPPPLIANNIFESNDVGILLWFHALAVVRNNIFIGNRNGLVANHFQDRTLVTNNVFFNNTELAIGNQAAYLDIINNVIVGSEVGIAFEYIQTGHIACNVFYANGANQNDERFAIGQDGNIEIDPHFVGNGDFHLTPNSPGHDGGCYQNQAFEPDGSAQDIGAYGGPLAAWTEL